MLFDENSLNINIYFNFYVKFNLFYNYIHKILLGKNILIFFIRKIIFLNYLIIDFNFYIINLLI